MKKLFTILLCGLISLTCLFSSACVYHEHDIDNYGFCKGCDYDSAGYLEAQANGSYISSITYFEGNEYYFFNMVGNGKTSYQFMLETYSGTPDFNAINIYTDNEYIIPVANFPHLYLPNSTVIEESFTFEEGVEYRIRVVTSPEAKGSAAFKITVL